MSEVLAYIVSNYTWIMIGAIIILLAIIGSYADKTNFGQGNKEEKDASVSDEKNTSMDANDILKNTISEENFPQKNLSTELNQSIIDKEIDDTNINNYANNNGTIFKKNLEVNSQINQADNGKEESFEEKFQKFDEIFNSVVPEKEVISGDLLEDIDNLSLEQEKLDTTSIPDLDDIELPKIKQVEKEETVWKF